MSKMTISQLAKEINVDVDKIISFVNEHGIEAKTGRKNVEDDMIELVKNTLVKNDTKSKPSEDNNQKDSSKNETTSDKKTSEDNKTSKATKTKENNKVEKENIKEVSSDKPKKKSKPVVVFRPQNTKDGERGATRMPRPGAVSKKGHGFRPTDNNGRKISFSQLASMRDEARQKAEKKAAEESRRTKNATRPQTSKPKNDQDHSIINTRPTKPIINTDIPGSKNNDNRKKNTRKAKDSKQSANPNANYNKRRGRKDKQIYDDNERQYKHPKKNPNQQKAKEVVEEEPIKLIQIPQTISIQELANRMKIQPSTIVKKLFMQGKVVTVNEEVTFETAEEIAIEFEVLVEHEVEIDQVAELLKEEEEKAENLKKRAPVVCVMGHVDHGKTSLLDAIRSTNVISREAGGITQHIGAYTVDCNGEPITFLDTPGHEAFTAMRLRGAQSTDIAILVVAADDGVMPQTIEAINHAKSAGVEIIVAVNKIDKPGASVDRVKQELAEHEILAEDWGGKVPFCPISAKTGEGIEDLLEMLLLTSEVMELKANPNRTARGIVIESKLDKGKGVVATVLVQKGTLHVGDSIAAGGSCGKVRAMINDKGERVKEAGPSVPVSVLGLSEAPQAGEIFIAPETEKEARTYADTFISQEKLHKLSENKTRVKMSLDDLYSQIQEGKLQELDIVVKADVQGSVEAIKQSLEKLSNEEVVVKVIHGGVGNISESDVSLAAASGAIIIGFNVKPDTVASNLADSEEVDIRLYSVIYNAIEDVENAMKGMLAPEYVEKVIGSAEVRQLFKASGVGTIAGSYVTDGIVSKNAKYRIYRGEDKIFEGELNSLKHFKDDVKEVKAGLECGFVFNEFNDVEEGDRIQAYIMEEVPRV